MNDDQQPQSDDVAQPAGGQPTLDTQAYAELLERRLTQRRRAAAQTIDPTEYVALQRSALRNAARLHNVLVTLSDADLLAWGADVVRRNFGGPVL